VKQVQGALPEGRELAYTSVATMMKILEAKGFISGEKGEKSISYSPRIQKADYESIEPTPI